MNLNHKQVSIRRFLRSLGFTELPNEYPQPRYDGYVCSVYCPIRQQLVQVGIRRPSLLDRCTVNYPDDEIPTWPEWTLTDPLGLIPDELLATV